MRLQDWSKAAVIGAYIVGWIDKSTDRSSHKGKRISVRECRELVEGLVEQGLLDVQVEHGSGTRHIDVERDSV